MYILQRHTRTLGHAEQWVVGNVELNTNLIYEALVKTAQQRTATCQIYTVLHDIGIQLGGSLFEGAEHGSLD